MQLRKVAFVSNQVEGEFLQGILKAEGVPSLLQRSGGFDVPDFLAAGPRNIMVPEQYYDQAKAILDSSSE